MAELIATRGLPGSGKSTWAKSWVAEDRENRIRVNRDTLRLMVDDGVWVDKVTEKRIVMLRNAVIHESLRKGYSVVVDDTNLPVGVIKDLRRIAQKRGAGFRIEDFTGVSPEICMDRDSHRSGTPGYVGADVIKGMYNKYLKNDALRPWDHVLEAYPLLPYIRTPGSPVAIIVDIDGTVAQMDGRSPYDYTKVITDLPRYQILDIVLNYAEMGFEILFVSGRSDSCRQDTMAWLNKILVESDRYHFRLFMRQEADTRPDWIVKYEIFDQHIRNAYDVRFVLDDRNQVVDMWRKIGLDCLQVAEGDF